MVHGEAEDTGGDWAPIEYRPLIDGGMLYHAATRRIHHLNLTAARVWEARDQDATVIAEKLCAEFDVDFSRALEDVRRILAEFAAAGLVRT